MSNADHEGTATPRGQAMPPEAQRIAIAEACGWTDVRGDQFTGLDGVSPEAWAEFGDSSSRSSPPYYLSDLNAMHEAEKVLLAQSRINKRATPFHSYHEILHGLCVMPPDTFNKPMQAEHWAICATAAQRAEAFLRTLNLWKMSPVPEDGQTATVSVEKETEASSSRVGQADTERALADILAERKRQDEKWGEQNHDAITYLAILIEECGELAQAALHYKFGGPEALGVRNEAVQVAAVALAIVQCLDRNEYPYGEKSKANIFDAARGLSADVKAKQ
jgi:NTP pyrophosphatase (non-canonical NTP hydrolase)